MSATYTYTLETASKSCTEISDQDISALDFVTDFKGAMDLADDVEFASAITESGEKVTVYRQIAAAK